MSRWLPPAPGPPLTFEVGRHHVRVEAAPGGWIATLDDRPLAGVFASRVDAWAAGVREADRVDRLPSG